MDLTAWDGSHRSAHDLQLALSGTRWLKSFLYGVKGTDPLAIAAAVLLVFALALLAGYLPARRAAGIDHARLAVRMTENVNPTLKHG
jgi:hypothetical protein